MRYAESINLALHDLMQTDDRVFVLGEDILDPYGGAFKITSGLSTKFPDRVLTTPISEAAITGFACGMALRGFKPVMEIMFGDFLTLCADQIVNGAGKFTWMYNEQVEIPLTIRTPMGGRRGYGPTHSQTLESLFLNVPGLTIVAPSHLHNPGTILSGIVSQSKSPTLFIENKLLYPEELPAPDQTSKTGDFFIETISTSSSVFPTVSITLAKNANPDVLLITYGGMTPLAMEAAYNLFMEEEIIVKVAIPSLVKPFPLEDCLACITGDTRAVIAEEGCVSAGWAAVSAAALSAGAFDSLARPVEYVGAKNLPIPSAKHLENKVLPQVNDLEAAIRKVLSR